MSMPPLTIQDQSFIDPQGRQVLLHGVAWINKDSRSGYRLDENPATFAQLRAWGFNCLRLGIFWDGLEPQPGVYNEAYLQLIDRQLELAAWHGLLVFLDMHQDLFSALFSDGAPAWATLTGGSPHLASSPVWSDAYFTSPAVQAALDAFWQNAPAPDGLGLQDHFARLWGMLAQRYRSCPNLIGYDLYNEPFLGAQAVQFQQVLFAKGAELLSALNPASETSPSSDPVGIESTQTGTIQNESNQTDPAETETVQAMAQQWLTPEGRFAFLQLLSDLDLYRPIIDSTQELVHAFEREKLMPFYQRVASAIRQEDESKLIFLETTMGSNLGVLSDLQPLTRPDGSRDPRQAYAPHGYDLVTDTENLAQASPERIELIFQRHAATARRLGLPMLVGEWGAYGDAPDTRSTAWQVVGVFEQLRCSETYWAYFPGIERTDSFQAVQRPFPECIAGELQNYRCEPQTRRFTCAWKEKGDLAAPSRIYLPAWLGFEPAKVKLEPWGDGFQVQPASPEGRNCFLVIPPTGKAVERMLEVNSPD